MKIDLSLNGTKLVNFDPRVFGGCHEKNFNPWIFAEKPAKIIEFSEFGREVNLCSYHVECLTIKLLSPTSFITTIKSNRIHDWCR